MPSVGSIAYFNPFLGKDGGDGLLHAAAQDRPGRAGRRRRAGLLPRAHARLDLGHGAVPAQQQPRPVQQRPVGQGPARRVRRRHPQAAVAVASARELELQRRDARATAQGSRADLADAAGHLPPLRQRLRAAHLRHAGADRPRAARSAAVDQRDPAEVLARCRAACCCSSRSACSRARSRLLTRSIGYVAILLAVAVGGLDLLPERRRRRSAHRPDPERDAGQPVRATSTPTPTRAARSTREGRDRRPSPRSNRRRCRRQQAWRCSPAGSRPS